MLTDADRIRNTLARFSQTLDDRQFEAWSQTFAEDGEFDGRARGRAALLSWILQGELATQPELKRKHAVVNSIITIDGDQAAVESDLVMFDQVAQAPWTTRVGRYSDRLARQPDGDWLLTWRRLVWMA
jgi:3-phenylpropionate/cinnamic acid dioxygenase small subunit